VNRKRLLFHILGIYAFLTICSLLAMGVFDYTWWKPISPTIGVDQGRTIILVLMHIGGIGAGIATAINLFDD
jgi:hypothetical protein